MFNVYDQFFFGEGAKDKSLARYGIIKKKWAALNEFYKLISVYRSRYKITLDEDTDNCFMDLCLIYSNMAAFARDRETGNVINAEVQNGNHWNRYGRFNNCTLTDYMGKSYGSYIPDEPGNVMPDCVIVYLNKYDVPPILKIKDYADTLAAIRGSINSCITNMRGNIMIQCTPEQAKVIEKNFKLAADGVPVFLAFEYEEGALQIKPEVITNPQTGDVLKALMETYDKIYANFLTDIGINANGVINKLSGISSDELAQNEEVTRLKYLQDYAEIKRGLDKVNEMFGKNYKIEPNVAYYREGIKNETNNISGISGSVGITEDF